MTDKIEKAIKDTESAFELWEDDRRCPGEDWSDIHESMDLAIAAVKAQEPRVVTLDELRECVTYWVEDENGHVVPETIMDITGKDIMTIPVVHLTNGYAPIITKTTDGYNSKRFTGWRCWTSRPTDAQRETTSWD